MRMVEPSHDVYAQLALENHDEDLSHVIEVYDFPSSFKTEDLFEPPMSLAEPSTVGNVLFHANETNLEH